MNIVYVAIALYVLAGVVYTLFLLVQRPINIFMIPINILGGPVLAIHYFVKYYFKKYNGPATIRHKDLLKDKQAAFFDLDGTIWDSNKVWLAALEKTALDNGFKNIDIASVYMPGTALKKTWRLLQKYNGLVLPKNKNIEVLAKETEQLVVGHINASKNLNLIEGFSDTAFFLKEEKGLKLALVTNSSREIAEAVAKKTGVDHYFDLILAGDEVRQKKPSPKIFLKAARKLKVSPRKVLVFEDSLAGSEAASKAGMDQIIIWRNDIPQVSYYGNIYGFYPDFIDLDKTINAPPRQKVLEGIEYLREKEGFSAQPETEH